MRVLAQPARRSDRTVEQHFQETIARPVVFREHVDLLEPSTLSALRRLFPDGVAQMWGVTPGKNGANLSEIRKMAAGDWVFFSGDKRLYLGGTVALTWHNPRLAERLWSVDGNGQTWEHMYALAGARDFNIPIEELRELLGWNPNRNIMRFQAFSQRDSELLQRHYSLLPSLPPGDMETVLPGLHSDAASAADLLGNDPEVDMLAKLALAKITSPPLAIALLGEWGAGKSSFMSQMHGRVDGLAKASTEGASDSGAFNANVLQIHFNAWHYNDEHVWSGLVAHLFRALAGDSETHVENLNPVAERERRAAELVRLEMEKQQLDEEMAQTERHRPRGYLAFIGWPVEGVRLFATAVRLGLRDIRHGWPWAVLWLLLIAAVVIAEPWIAAWLALLLKAVSVSAIPMLSILKVARRRHSQGLSWTGKLRGSLKERQRTLGEEIVSARARFAEIDAAVNLSQFLKERSDTYQTQRGLLGAVHHDLSKLHKSLREAHEESGAAQRPPLERIILYVDDLDRCTPRRVVEVLAAVHLMLALPLFVVVVAVDPKWLIRSLEYHYSELFTDSAGRSHTTSSQDATTPLDYLDKIFQIPFVVPPSTPEKAARLINSLLSTPDLTSSVSEHEEKPVDSEEQSTPTGENERPEPAAEQEGVAAGSAVQLLLQPHEIAFMTRVVSLTQTPRAIKKMINIYRLVRIGVPSLDLPRFEGTAETPGEYQVVQILLALLVANPQQSEEVFRAVVEASPATKITEVLRGVPSDFRIGNRVAELIEQINAEVSVIMDTAVYQQWCPKLARYSFYTWNFAS